MFRVLAALTVFFHHFAFVEFTGERYLWFHRHNLGFDGVIIFFVLSGLVISFCGDNKDPTMRSFVFARATRLFSVAIPAIFIGFACDRIGASLYPDFYAEINYNPIGLVHSLVSGVTFSSEWWISSVRLGTNGPYWSLSYEAAYYALFAVIFYMRSQLKWVIAVAMCAVFGPAIVLLLPCWLIGWASWRFIATGRQLSTPLATLCAFGPAPVFAYCALTGVDKWLGWVNFTILPRPFFHLIELRAQWFEWGYILSVLVALHLIGMHALLRRVELPETARWMSAVKFLAGSSFSIYLLHYPLLFVLAPTLDFITSPVLHDLALGGTTIAICLASAVLFERTLGQQRRALQNLGARLSGQPAKA